VLCILYLLYDINNNSNNNNNNIAKINATLIYVHTYKQLLSCTVKCDYRADKVSLFLVADQWLNSAGTGRNGVPPLVSGIPPPEIDVPSPKVVAPPPGDALMVHTE